MSAWNYGKYVTYKLGNIQIWLRKECISFYDVSCQTDSYHISASIIATERALVPLESEPKDLPFAYVCGILK